ncbi:hypothetical protein AB0F17_66070 [Nonomuraea sp. NPDC026600]|uniref:hypothetical protein n=1 Tax=Nonomuraea sp. NPDC026600 TaxID=3155363 RepID=UPI0033EC8F1F
MTDGIEDKKLAGLLTAFDLAYQRAVNAVTNDRDLDRAFRRVTALGDHVQALREQLTLMRATTAAQLYASDDDRSYSKLAERVGISKARAAQLVTQAKEADMKQYDSQLLTDQQRDGIACVVCQAEPRTMRPVGRSDQGQVFACSAHPDSEVERAG